MKILKKIFFSTKTTFFLCVILSIFFGIATFIEQKYSTNVARIFIYESKWIEIIILWIAINLIINICKYKLWNYRKIPVFIFHFSFLFIIIGSFLSRYLSQEGLLPLKEGTPNNQVISQKNYIKININQGSNHKIYEYPYILSSFHYKFHKKISFQGNPLELKILKYIPCAKIYISKKNPIKKIIKIILSNDHEKKRIEAYIKNGEKIMLNGIYFSFNHKKNYHGINFFEKNKKIYIKSTFHIEYINMKNRKSNSILKNHSKILDHECLYRINVNPNLNIYWVIPNKIVKGELKYFQSCKKEDEKNSVNAITGLITFQNKKKIITFLSSNNQTHQMSNPIIINNCKLSIGYGPIYWKLPFYLRLNKFIIKNYPGSNNPSSFMSKITLIDNNKYENHSIYMNNILNYKGYRFFQSGYDSDQNNTYLFVNKNYLGTYFLYIGYFLISIGMIFTIFWKGTRFNFLRKQLQKIKNSKKIFILFIFITLSLFNTEKVYSQINKIHPLKNLKLDDISDFVNIPKKHSEKFGKILVQDPNGRIKPINTLAIELLRKIYKKDKIDNLDANQWFISIHQDNIFWMRIPFIKVEKEIRVLKNIHNNNYASLIDFYFFDPITSKLKYILEEDYKNSFSKNPIDRNQYDKAVIKTTERIGIIHEIFQGKYIRIFPIPNDSNHSWSSWLNPNDNKINILGFTMFSNYLKSIINSQIKKNWNIANEELNKIIFFQKKNSHIILPSSNKISAEILYNKINIFYYLTYLYSILGIIILINSFLNIFIEKKFFFFIYKISSILLFILFIFESLGLITRWYISNHAPWTNGYESAVFISWCVLGIGFLFKKNNFLLGVTPLISSILLLMANSSAMDPEITNLVPVLKSSWLIIHVATITSSYGFFFTSSFLGFLTLIFFILKKFLIKFQKEIYNQLKKLTIINEMCLTIGIFLLTIGTFLGSIWANNSWGRSWSWDPKETWALISIIIYAFVLHTRFIPIFKNIVIFNFLSVLSVSSIIMTYFGVNYFLSGLHSYAKGDPISIPYWIYYALIILFTVFFFAFLFEKNNNKINI